jgi:4-hydroxy-3-methylbut-2-enyl diphosphate reductase
MPALQTGYAVASKRSARQNSANSQPAATAADVQAMRILLATPRGFCAGVERAIEIVARTLATFGPPIYVRHEVVHNRFVVDGLRAKGAVFVDDLADVPDGATVIFSAHGVSRAVQDEAQRRHLRVFDATCPLVTKVHSEVVQHHKRGREVVLIGHAGHPEVEGTMGQVSSGVYLVQTLDDVSRLQVKDARNLAYATQTTLSVDDTSRLVAALRARFPDIHCPRRDDICYATQSRQDAVKRLAESCGVVLVVGSPSSSNSNRLREVAAARGARAYLIEGARDIADVWVEGVQSVGVTAGASAPEVLVEEVVTRLKGLGGTLIPDDDALNERVVFPLPRELR